MRKAYYILKKNNEIRKENNLFDNNSNNDDSNNDDSNNNDSNNNDSNINRNIVINSNIANSNIANSNIANKFDNTNKSNNNINNQQNNKQQIQNKQQVQNNQQNNKQQTQNNQNNKNIYTDSNNQHLFDDQQNENNNIGEYINEIDLITNNLLKSYNFNDLKFLNKLKNSVLDLLSNIKKISLENNINNNILVILHVSNIDIFNDMFTKYKNFFTRENNLIFVTIYEQYHNDIIKRLIPQSIIEIIDNKGDYLGGYLKSLRKIIKLKNIDSIDYVYFLHTKQSKDKDIIFDSLLNNYKSLEEKYNDYEHSLMISHQNLKCSNNIAKNIKYLREFYNRYKSIFVKYNINSLDNFNEYFNEYITEFYENDGKNKLFFDIDFYKSNDIKLQSLNNNDVLMHWYNQGKNEYYRIPNPNYIKKFGKDSYYFDDSIFMCNRKYFNFLRNFTETNYDYEFSILENGIVNEDVERKSLMWNNLFGLICTITFGDIISLNDNNEETIEEPFNMNLYKKLNTNIIELLKSEQIEVEPIEDKYYDLKQIIKIQSSINKSLDSANIAIFLIMPKNNNKLRILLKYINYLYINNINVDIYLGYDTYSLFKYNGYSTVNDNLSDILKILDSYSEINLLNHNFYLGFQLRKTYKILIISDWKTSQSVYFNKNNCEKICYIVQDLEYLIDQDKKEIIEKNYKSDNHYYCISSYISKLFKKYSNNIFKSFLGVDRKTFCNLNLQREKSIIFWYDDTVNKILTEKIIDIVSNLNIKCYIYPDVYLKDNENIINLSTNININEYFNNCMIGINLSSNIPTRIGYSMLVSGLKVIENDTEYTQYDLPNDIFTKIKNEENIIDKINELFDVENDYNDLYVGYLNIYNELNNLLNFINQLS